MEEKCLEFFLNENEYSVQKEEQLIKEIKKEERVKEVKLEVTRNEWGIYIVKAIIYQRKLGNLIYISQDEIEEEKRRINREKSKKKDAIYSSLQNFKVIEFGKTKEEIKPKQTKYEKYTNKSYGQYKSQGEFKPY